MLALILLAQAPQIVPWRPPFGLLIWLDLACGLAGLLIGVSFVQTPRTQAESLAIWEAAYYCRPDDLVFIPGYPYRAGSATFHWLIREYPQQWLLRRR